MKASLDIQETLNDEMSREGDWLRLNKSNLILWPLAYFDTIDNVSGSRITEIKHNKVESEANQQQQWLTVATTMTTILVRLLKSPVRGSNSRHIIYTTENRQRLKTPFELWSGKKWMQPPHPYFEISSFKFYPI